MCVHCVQTQSSLGGAGGGKYRSNMDTLVQHLSQLSKNLHAE